MSSQGNASVDLKTRPDLIAEYVALRNLYAEPLLTRMVSLEETREWLAGPGGTAVELWGWLGPKGQLDGVAVLYVKRAGEVAVFAREPGRGLGQRLLRLIEPPARKRGLNSIWAWVRSDNPRARALFLKNGYQEECSEAREYCGSTVAGLRLRLDLENRSVNEASTRIGILQPGYLPWLGFFEQIHATTTFVLYDDVQYDKHGWRNRNRIKTAHGPLWLTVPVHFSLANPQTVREIRIENRSSWRKTHLASIKQNYSKATFFKNYIPLFEEGLGRSWENLADLDEFFIRGMCDAFGLLKGRRLVRSSELKVSGGQQERLIEICHRLGATAFYEGAAGRDYIDVEKFAAAGIRVDFQDYMHPIYRQLHGEFIPYLSALDLLFNHGDESLAILCHCKRYEPAGNPEQKEE